MKKWLFASLIACMLVPAATAQYNLDYGIKVGGANYLGEIGGNEKTRQNFVWDMKLVQTGFSIGAFARYRFHPFIYGNVGLTYGRIRGNDALSSNLGRHGRNLSFRNDIFDLSARGEVYLYHANDVARRGLRLDFRTYAFAGASVFHHNPKASNPDYNNGEWTALQPLNTQGLDKKYSRWGFSIPAGIGVFFTYDRDHRIGWELAWHTTFTDHLDDAGTEFYPDQASVDPEVFEAFTDRSDEVDPSQLPDGGLGNYGGPEDKRADPSNNDGYVFTSLTYSKVITVHNNYYSPFRVSKESRKKMRSRYYRSMRVKF